MYKPKSTATGSRILRWLFILVILFCTCSPENGFDPGMNLVPDINLMQDATILENSSGVYNFGLKIADGNDGFTTGYVSFTIENLGIENLDIFGIALGPGDTADFDLVSTATSPVIPDGFTSFIIRFDPLDSGNKTATVAIENNDPDEAPYTFTVTGQTEHRLIPATAAGGDSFGKAVTLAGNFIIAGAPGDDEAGPDAGAVYLFPLDNWLPDNYQKLRAGTGATGFGLSLAAADTRLAAGAPYDDDQGPDAGAVYIYACEGDTWVIRDKLLAPDSAGGDNFGMALSISGDYLFIGAPNKPDRGVVYVYQFDGVLWNYLQTFSSPGGTASEGFGSAISISNDTALVGAPLDAAGCVYYFLFDGATWEFSQELIAGNGSTGDLFGTALAITDTHAFIGAPGHNNSGAGYLFRKTGAAWEFLEQLADSSGNAGDNFGFAGALAGENLFISAPGADKQGTASGCVYHYYYDGTGWQERSTLIPPDVDAEDSLGFSLSLSDQYGLAGTPGKESNGNGSGAVYIYKF